MTRWVATCIYSITSRNLVALLVAKVDFQFIAVVGILKGVARVVGAFYMSRQESIQSHCISK